MDRREFLAAAGAALAAAAVAPEMLVPAAEECVFPPIMGCDPGTGRDMMSVSWLIHIDGKCYMVDLKDIDLQTGEAVLRDINNLEVGRVQSPALTELAQLIEGDHGCACDLCNGNGQVARPRTVSSDVG